MGVLVVVYPRWLLFPSVGCILVMGVLRSLAFGRPNRWPWVYIYIYIYYIYV